MLTTAFRERAYSSLALLSDAPYEEETISRGTKRFRDVGPDETSDSHVMLHSSTPNRVTVDIVKTIDPEHNIGGTYKLNPVAGEPLVTIGDLDRPVSFWNPEAAMESDSTSTPVCLVFNIQQLAEFLIEQHSLCLAVLKEQCEDGTLEFEMNTGQGDLTTDDAALKVEHLLKHRYAYSCAIDGENAGWYPLHLASENRCTNFREHYSTSMMFTDPRILATHINIAGICRGSSGTNSYGECIVSADLNGECLVYNMFPDMHYLNSKPVLWIKQESYQYPCVPLFLDHRTVPVPKDDEIYVRIGIYGCIVAPHNSSGRLHNIMSEAETLQLAETLQARCFDGKTHPVDGVPQARTLVPLKTHEDTIGLVRMQPLIGFMAAVDPMDSILRSFPMCGRRVKSI
jgi:hypothetical protein